MPPINHWKIKNSASYAGLAMGIHGANPKETEMDANQYTNADLADDVIELGAASIETKGQMGITENFGAVPLDGISDA